MTHKGWQYLLALFLSRFLNTKRAGVYLDIGQAGYAVRNRLIAGENDLKMEAGELDAEPREKKILRFAYRTVFMNDNNYQLVVSLEGEKPSNDAD